MHNHAFRWWAIGVAVAIAVFAAYISLVPFDFAAPPTGMTVGDLLRARLETSVRSLDNLVANALMFVPFGLAGAAALVGAGTRRTSLATALILGASLALSAAIEFGQVFVVRRTPSIVDMAAQTLGTLLGIGTWMVLGGRARALIDAYGAGERRALEVALTIYAAIQFLVMLGPFGVTMGPDLVANDVRAAGAALNPFDASAFRLDVLRPAVTNWLHAIPVGVLAAIAGRPAGTRRAAAPALAVAAIFYAACEAVQVLAHWRAVDVVGLVASISGAVTGVVLTIVRLPMEGAPSPTRGQIQGWTIAGLVTFAGVYSVYNLAPFDFVLSRDLTEARIGGVLAPPFRSYYANPEFKAIRDLLLKVGLALPLGVIFQLGIRPLLGRHDRIAAAAWLFLTAAFFTLIEFGQALLPGRYPDNTDIILATAGVSIGMLISGPFGQPVPDAGNLEPGTQ